MLSASISLPEPVPAADKVSRRIRRYYQLQCRSFLRYCETYLLPAAAEEYRAALLASLPLPHFRAELTYQVTYNDGGLWSLYTQSRESGFSGRPTLLRHGDTWDLTSGLSGASVRLLSPPQRMEAAADGGSGGGGPAAGDGWDLPVP